MSKARSAVADYAVYLVVRIFVCIIQCLSLNASRAFAAGLAWLIHRVDRRHRAVAWDNLRAAYPGRYTDAELDQMVRAVYRHFCTLLTEIIHLPRRVHPTNWRNYIGMGGCEALTAGLTTQRPLLIVTCHLGNWEMAGFGLGLLGFRTYAIARVLDNPYLEDYLLRFRETTGQQILAKKGDFDQIQSILARGGVIATLADQDAGQRGLFVDFFGRPASTHKAVALMALEHRVPLIVVGAVKVGEPMRYQLYTPDFILPEEYEGQPDAVRKITQRFTTALEQLIRKAPEQYFWLHRRWKHQPQEKRKKKAA